MRHPRASRRAWKAPVRKYHRFALARRQGRSLPFPWTRDFPGKRIEDDEHGRARWLLNGYVLIHEPTHPLASRKHGTAHEHRMAVYDAGISTLPPGVQVHHINGDRRDNRLENLRVAAREAHAAHHAYRRRQDRQQ